MVSKNQIKYVRQLEQKKWRRREGAFVAEGPKVVGDLLRAGFVARMVFATEAWEGWCMQSGSPVAQTVTDEELRKISFLQHPQQVLAVFEMPASTMKTDSLRPVEGLLLALDGVQDPGNLGTIIRIADWFGIGTIVCSEDTADAWNPKVVQATMGSIARVNIIYINMVDFLEKTQVPIFGTLLDGENIYQQELPSNGIIVMGNEGNGISEPVRRLVTHKLLIPAFREGAESLNVAIATAITCSEFRRR
ncbi:MAG: RNA methyltransferase [Prevotella sp.]|nr:RNA methyltransferase [Prevotella sp.]